jgi:hypothetical protein
VITNYQDIERWQREPIVSVAPERKRRSAHKPQGDVRGSSIDRRYMGKPFSGPMDHAIAQARAAREYPIPNVKAAKRAGVSLARYELLSFLRLV